MKIFDYENSIFDKFNHHFKGTMTEFINSSDSIVMAMVTEVMDIIVENFVQDGKLTLEEVINIAENTELNKEVKDFAQDLVEDMTDPASLLYFQELPENSWERMSDILQYRDSLMEYYNCFDITECRNRITSEIMNLFIDMAERIS